MSKPRSAVAFATLVSLSIFGCDEVAQDGENDRFLAGKADTGGIQEGDARAHAVLRVVNEADFAALDEAASLSAMTAQAIIDYRASADGVLGTDDDDEIETLAELDAIPYVGPMAFDKLLDYATSLGYIVYDWRSRISRAQWSPDAKNTCVIEAPADASELQFLVEAGSTFWGISVRDSTGTEVQYIHPPFHGWTAPIPGNRAYYLIHHGTSFVNCESFRSVSRAVKYKIPVAVDDPFACTIDTAWQAGSDDATFQVGGIPNTGYWAGGNGCATHGISLRFTPPTDGEYTVSSFDHTRLSLREDGCAGELLSCDVESVKGKLVGGEPVVVGVAEYEDGTFVRIERQQQELTCDDAFDNDGDGMLDCDDSDCAWQCKPEESCDNGIDDDADGDPDCLDSECKTSALCGANDCPGVEMGSATGDFFEPLAGGTALDAPVYGILSCDSLTWTGSRRFMWTAPSGGSYVFRANQQSGPGFYDLALRVYDGTCDGDVLDCSSPDGIGTHNAGVRLPMVAGQVVVIEVGMGRMPDGATSTFGIEIIKE